MIAETEGVFQPSWSIDDVAQRIDAIRDTGKLWMLPPVPAGYLDHLTRSFDMARKGLAAGNKDAIWRQSRSATKSGDIEG